MSPMMQHMQQMQMASLGAVQVSPPQYPSMGFRGHLPYMHPPQQRPLPFQMQPPQMGAQMGPGPHMDPRMLGGMGSPGLPHPVYGGAQALYTTPVELPGSYSGSRVSFKGRPCRYDDDDEFCGL
jgi:hypothetical protein